MAQWILSLTHWPLGDVTVILKVSFSNSVYWIVAMACVMKLLSSECCRPLMRSQYWFRLWIGAVGQQAITETNVDPYLFHHMASLDHDELNPELRFSQIIRYLSAIGTSKFTLTDWSETRWPPLSRHFQMHFLEWKWIAIKISLKFVPKGPIDNIPALVQILAWHWTGDKPLSEPMMAWFFYACKHHSASMS